jgi:hypothetical protein
MSVMAGLTQALHFTVEKLLFVALMRVDVVDHVGRHHNSLLRAHAAQRFGVKLG